jgi:hypothetical protein
MSSNEAKLLREFDLMTKLHGKCSAQFVELFALLRGAAGQIVPAAGGEQNECSNYVAIAMEKGEMDMKTYLPA